MPPALLRGTKALCALSFLVNDAFSDIIDGILNAAGLIWRGCSCNQGPVVVLECDLSKGQCQEFLARLGLSPLMSSGEFQPLSASFDLNERAPISRRNGQGKKNNSLIHVLCSWGRVQQTGSETEGTAKDVRKMLWSIQVVFLTKLAFQGEVWLLLKNKQKLYESTEI